MISRSAARWSILRLYPAWATGSDRPSDGVGAGVADEGDEEEDRRSGSGVEVLIKNFHKFVKQA
jgi:hypothetical protein